jgi:SUF system NifU family Fe-S assembly protein
MCGPTGIGVLWGRAELLELMPPFLSGGSMIETVTMTRTTFAPPPARFEAGTPPIAEAVGLGAAVDYLTGVGMEAIAWHEKELTAYALEALAGVPDLRIFGPRVPVGRGGTISFELGGVHPHDVGQVLDSLGIQVRVGHHWCRRHDEGIVLPLQHNRRCRCTGAGAGSGPGGVRLMQLAQLYQDIILDHYRHPRGRGLREPYCREVRAVNPTCGDEIELRVQLADGRIDDLSYDGAGCSISQAAASVLYEVVLGRTVEEALQRVEAFTAMISGRGEVPADEELIEDGVAFAGVSKYPARVKCALLPWLAFRDATGAAAGKVEHDE